MDKRMEMGGEDMKNDFGTKLRDRRKREKVRGRSKREGQKKDRNIEGAGEYR